MVVYGKTNKFLYRIEESKFTVCRTDTHVCYVIDFDEMKCFEKRGDEARKIIEDIEKNLERSRETSLRLLSKAREIEKRIREIEEELERELEKLLEETTL